MGMRPTSALVSESLAISMTDQPSFIPLTNLLHTVLKKYFNFLGEKWQFGMSHTLGKKLNIRYIDFSFLALLAA